jgi:uncharacterized protein YkwD
MNRALPAFLLIAVAAVAGGCTTLTDPIRTGPGYGIAELGGQRIGDSVDIDLLASLTLDYVNLYRARYDLPRLNLDRRAAQAAQWMASYQASRSAVTHVADVPSMRIFPMRYRACGGVAYERGVENAGWYKLFEADSLRNLTYDEMARRIVDGWINSPSHHRNLIARAGNTEGLVGVGIARGRYATIDGIYSTLNVFFPWPDQATLEPEPVRRGG